MVLYALRFLPYSYDNEFKQAAIGKQVKFTHIAKPAFCNTENVIKAINSEKDIAKYFRIKDLNSICIDIGNQFSFFHLKINSLSFHFDELKSLILRKLRKQLHIFVCKIITLNMHQLNQLMGECCCISKE